MPKNAGQKKPAVPAPPAQAEYDLVLYISGATEHSRLALANLAAIGKKHLRGNYRLEIVDIYQDPAQAVVHEIVATPTLVKRLPLPLRRMIGDLSSEERVLVGLDLVPRPVAEGKI
jgi:circadian clock protein KaiB